MGRWVVAAVLAVWRLRPLMVAAVCPQVWRDCAVEGDVWRSPVAVWGDGDGFAAAAGSGAAGDVV